MKNLMLVVFLLATTNTFSQFNRDPYIDSDEGNFHLRNGKAFFQRIYNAPASFDALENKLMSYNTPNSGFQVKKNQ